MKDLELIDKLMDTNYFLDKVVLKDKEFDLTFRHTTISTSKLEIVLDIIKGRFMNCMLHMIGFIYSLKERKHENKYNRIR